jgi:carboxypeptidase Taq
MASLEADLAVGDYQPLLEWLRREVHQHGSIYTPGQLIERITGKPLGVEDHLSYLDQKLAE